jgi:hypothetical protein
MSFCRDFQRSARKVEMVATAIAGSTLLGILVWMGVTQHSSSQRSTEAFLWILSG